MTKKEKRFMLQGRMVAYAPVVCANGWKNSATRHTVEKGGLLARVLTDEFVSSKMAVSPKINIYCVECYEKLKAQVDEHNAQLRRVAPLEL